MSRKRVLWLMVLIVIGGTGWISYRAFHQATLDRDLIAVSAKGDPSRMRALLTQGADPNTSEGDTAGSGWQHLLNLLLRHGRMRSHTDPLTLALSGPTPPDANHIEVIRLLLEHGANPNVVNANGDSALNWAAGQQNTRIITLLLAHGADVNHKNSQGQTALTSALPHEDPEKDDPVDVLLAAGADVNTPDLQGYSPFLFALMLHSPHAASMLAHGADVRRPVPLSAREVTISINGSLDGSSQSISVSYVGAPGATPLMLAVQNENAALVHSMLAKGADVNAQDAKSKTALDYAKASPEIRATLQQAGSRH